MVDENGCPELMEYIVVRMNLLLQLSQYLSNTASSEFSLACAMLIEKSKDEDILMQGAGVKRDYVRYTVQNKCRGKQPI